ncbi:hypothetical protein CDL15_Pgr025984 [Punica granatum]|uniref:Uncharacterized protein n=1 Tax=Punica granatum TaxID=22663 RepID=A0A218WB86_PUNGR|nr:hypothetical protein CDL15_Pgr025984 [Punica granatum]
MDTRSWTRQRTQRTLYSIRDCDRPRELVSPLKRLLAGNAPVSLLGLLLARRLLVTPPDAGPAGMVVLC